MVKLITLTLTSCLKYSLSGIFFLLQLLVKISQLNVSHFTRFRRYLGRIFTSGVMKEANAANRSLL